MYKNCGCFKFDEIPLVKILGDCGDLIPDNFIFHTWVTMAKSQWFFGRLASVAKYFAQFYVDTRKLLKDFWSSVLEQNTLKLLDNCLSLLYI